MFIAALFTIAKTWKHPKCPSTDEWIKKMWYIYTMEYYSAIMPFAAPWMDLQIIILSQTERQISYDITYMFDLKYDINKLIYETETDSQTSKINLWLQKGKCRRDKLGV